MRTLMLTCAALLIGTAFAGENGHKFDKDHPVVKLKPGHWFEVPDSHLSKVAFKWPAGIRHGRIGSIMGAWSSGAYDTKRERLIIWGGGHSDYAGNELYVFDVKELKWERINDPSTKLDRGRGETYPDGLPRSVHTYDYIEYVPSIDRFVSMGLGATWPSGVGGGNATWCFDFEAKKWERLTPRTESRKSQPLATTALDPVTGRLWGSMRGGRFFEWDPPKNKWAKRGGGRGPSWRAMAVVDPIARKYYAFGGGVSTGFDIAAEGELTAKEVATKGPQEMVNAYAPGMEYDPVLDKVVSWHGGANVFTLDLEKMEWEKLSPAAGNKVTPAPSRIKGIYSRFRYMPSMNAYILANTVKQNVYIHRLTDRTKQPIPKRFKEALKKKDPKLVKWVAGQVAKWPKKTAEPVLKAALKDQRANKEATGLIQAAIKKLGAK